MTGYESRNPCIRNVNVKLWNLQGKFFVDVAI